MSKSPPQRATLRDKLIELGSEFGKLQESLALVRHLHVLPHPGITIQRDLSYGSHERHRLDIYTSGLTGPRQETRPVLVFVPGGGFVGGDKALPNEPLYQNVGSWAASTGLVGVTLNHRLAPEHPWPAGPEDLGAAVAWLRQNVSSMNGDPNQIYIMGHSAGAAHVAAYIAHPEFHQVGGSGVAGAILVGGLYNLCLFEGSLFDAYYGSDRRLLADKSAVPFIKKVTTRVMIALAEFEPVAVELQAFDLLKALFERDGRFPWFVRLRGHNHYTELFAFGTEYEPALANNIEQFIGSCQQS